MKTGMTIAVPVKGKENTPLLKRIRMAGSAAYAAVIVGVYTLSAKVNCFLAGNEADFLKKGGNKTFNSLNKTAKETGASATSLIKTLGIIAIVIAIMLAGASLALTKNATKREENKSHLGWIFVGGAILFGVFGLVGLIADVGNNI